MLRLFAIIVTNVHELKFKDICVYIKRDDPFAQKLYFKAVLQFDIAWKCI